MIAWRAKSRLVDSRSRPKPAELVARSASLDRLPSGRQSSPKRSWLGLTEPVLQHDRVRRLAHEALMPIAFLCEAPARPFPCQPCAISKTNVQTNACIADQGERAAPAFILPSLPVLVDQPAPLAATSKLDRNSVSASAASAERRVPSLQGCGGMEHRRWKG
jgi:hypothetical protein